MSSEPDIAAAAKIGDEAPSTPLAKVAVGDNEHGDLRQMLHELRQPLNNIQLATILLRNRTVPLLQGSEQEYLMRRLERIEGQVARAVEIADRMANGC